MQAMDIEKYLAHLGQELTNLGMQEPVRVLMIGGAYRNHTDYGTRLSANPYGRRTLDSTRKLQKCLVWLCKRYPSSLSK